MSVLFDTNVVLDVLLARKPFAAASNACFLQVEDGQLRGLLGATTVTTLDYLVFSTLGAAKADNTFSAYLTCSTLHPSIAQCW